MADKTVYIIDIGGNSSEKLKVLRDDAKKTDSEFAKLGKNMAASIAGAFAVSSIIDLGKETVFAAAKMQGMENAIRFASGSAEEGAKNLAFLKNITQTMPIDLVAAQEGFKTFSGAVMGSSLEGDKARHIFTSVSKAASVMGLSADDTKGIFLALGQMVSKGTVQAEELKGQLGERLPGAFQLAAKAMSLTTAQLGDYMKKGLITAEDLLPRLANELDKTYTKGMGQANESITAHLTELNNMKNEIVSSSIPAVQEFTSILVDSAKEVKDNWEPMRDLFLGIKESMVDIISPFTDLLGLFGDADIGTYFKIFATGALSAYSALRYLILSVDVLGKSMAALFTFDMDYFSKSWEEYGQKVNKIGEDYYNIWKDDKDPTSGKKSNRSANAFGMPGLGLGLDDKEHQYANGEWGIPGLQMMQGQKREDNPFVFGQNYIAPWKAGTVSGKKKGKKGKKESAGGITLNESRNGATNVIFNIDTFQKNEISNAENGQMGRDDKNFLDKMSLALLTILNDAQIAAVR